MNVRRTGFATAAIVVLAAVPITLDVARAQMHPPQRPGGPFPEVRARLHDGRMAMIKEALRLDEAQLKLWAPVEAQLRAAFAARQRARAERQEKRRQNAGRPSLPDRLDRKSQRLTERAERANALAAAFRPFYASLSDEQKAVGDLVLRPVLAGPRRYARRRFMRPAAGAEQR